MLRRRSSLFYCRFGEPYQSMMRNLLFTARAAIAPLQSCLQAGHEILVGEGFLQEADRAGFDRTRSNAVVGEGGYQDDRNLTALRDQVR